MVNVQSLPGSPVWGQNQLCLLQKRPFVPVVSWKREKALGQLPVQRLVKTALCLGAALPSAKGEPWARAFWGSVLEASELVFNNFMATFLSSLVLLGIWIYFLELSFCLKFVFRMPLSARV